MRITRSDGPRLRGGDDGARAAGPRRVTSRRWRREGDVAEHASSDEKPRVLIVDDDPDERRLRRRQLDPAFEIQEAGDAQAAFRLIEQQRFDVVMLDVVMPGTSGIDACRAIKAAARERDELLPVLLVTGLDAPDD